MNLNEITPLILTYNEQENLSRTLAALKWAKQIVIVDSGSDDDTLRMIRAFPNTTLFHRDFDHFAEQCNFGLTKIQTPWVLSLDADYICSDQFASEIDSLNIDGSVAYRAGFVYSVFGRDLRATLYPSRVVLYQRKFATYRRDGHAHRVQVDGRIGDLRSKIRHDDRKPTTRWLQSQCKYADLEVEKLRNLTPEDLGWKDRIRTWIVLAPPLTLVYCLFAKGMILDGWAGLYYTLQRVIAELILSLKLLDYRLRHEDVNRPAIAESQPERRTCD